MTTADPQMLKGVLPMLLLALLHQQPDYGYALVLRLRAAGLTQAAEGSVYPALSRLEAQGALASHLQASSGGPARKYYSPTPAGTAELTRAHTAWHALVQTVATTVTAVTDSAARPDPSTLSDPAPPADHTAGHPTSHPASPEETSSPAHHPYQARS